jgi:hypothetical protein
LIGDKFVKSGSDFVDNIVDGRRRSAIVGTGEKKTEREERERKKWG